MVSFDRPVPDDCGVLLNGVHMYDTQIQQHYETIRLDSMTILQSNGLVTPYRPRSVVRMVQEPTSVRLPWTGETIQDWLDRVKATVREKRLRYAHATALETDAFENECRWWLENGDKG